MRLRLLLIDDIISIVINGFLLLDLMRMVNYHISLEVELRGIEFEILGLLHAFLKILLHFVVEVGDNRMSEQILPLDAFVRVDGQHTADDIFGDF